MLIGRGYKTPSEVYRYTVDFEDLGWLDTGETLTAITTPVVTLNPNAYPGPFPNTPFIDPDALLPPDPTPLTVLSAAIITSDTQVQLFLQAGTDGNGYSVSYDATGTSGRVKTIRFDMSVRLSSVRAVA